MTLLLGIGDNTPKSLYYGGPHERCRIFRPHAAVAHRVRRCSGFQYGFDFAEQTADDDTVIEIDDVGMVVDPLSYQYLVGSTVDFEEGLAGARFVIKNPNATSTCGCGSSFMV